MKNKKDTISRAENIANQIINHYYDGMNAGSDFVADVVEDFSNTLNKIYKSIDMLQKKNKKLRQKNKQLGTALEVYKRFESSMPFSIKEFNGQ